MSPILTRARHRDRERLLPLVRDYHAFEGIDSTAAARVEALQPLLDDDSTVGRIWMISTPGSVVGYIALCFGYSIELGGRDAFIDEFFLREDSRGKGIGAAVLEAVKREAARCRVRTLHLEVAATNLAAARLYSRCGFEPRDRFHLMSCRIDPDRH